MLIHYICGMVQIRFTSVTSRIKSCFKQWGAGKLLLPIILFATLLITGFVTADTALPPFGSSPFPAPKITASSVFQENEWWKAEARNMVRLQIKQRGIEDERLLQVMRNTPRHRFVPEPYSGSAYSDSPLPIGHDQTISQPYIVALMTNLLDVDQQHKVLEVGTGSGYQAAILARMAGEVYSIEIVQELAQSAKALLDDMGYDNVHVKWGDGYQGWPAEKPFDRIIVTAAPKRYRKRWWSS
ncbi:MAG: protein-L-isoaspartate(D-aspartate) O-methyltransferase [Bacteroidales bacterium]|nr:protein-L-isoaspartate(D-aspartate) O-methyltransferase [Bacteroidales bacterium]